MRAIATFFTILSALGATNGMAIDKRQSRSIMAADITATGFRFPLESNVQPFTVDTAGYYRFYLQGGGGGRGGNDTSPTSGRGATAQGAYVLLPGETYLAVVGQRGGTGTGTPEISAGGGGGGSFVYRGSDNQILVAAGGGGGNNFNGTYIGLDAVSSAATSGTGNGGAANPGAGGAGAGFFSNGANAGTVQGAKGGLTKNTWSGGAVDSRQTGAQGSGGFGGGGGGGKYSGGGGGGYSGGNGGPISGNLGRPQSPGSGGTSYVFPDPFNGFQARETQYPAVFNAGNGQVAIRFLAYYTAPNGPYTPPPPVIVEIQ